MAKVQINDASPIRFDGGGEFILNNGTDDLVFNSVETGTIEITPGGYEVLNWTDRGDQKSPLHGNERLSEIRGTFKLTNETDATALENLAQAVDAATGGPKVYPSLTVKIPGVRGGTTGKSYSFASVYFPAQPFTVRTGADFDTVPLTIMSITPLATVAAY